MGSILVSDTNIWIDFHRAGLLDTIFRLPYTFCTSDFVKTELTNPEAEHLIALGLTMHSLDGAEVARLYGLCQSLNNSSLADISCLFLASKLNCPLLTGDGRLRKVAVKESVIVYGSLWLLDRLVSNAIISKEKAAAGLRAMMAENGRLPGDECEKRLAAWSISLKNPEHSII